MGGWEQSGQRTISFYMRPANNNVHTNTNTNAATNNDNTHSTMNDT